MKYFQTHISKFFSRLKPDSVLFFATYSLDEIVLAKLFSENKINKNREILILCDVRRHKAQGYLKAFGYKRLQVCEVILKKTTKKCPVFHPKLWMELSPDFKYAYKILAGSFNISEYHFNQENTVLDTASFIEKPTRINFASRLKPFMRSSESGTSRAKITAFTYILDLRNTPILTISARAAGPHIKELIAAKPGDKPKGFCSPFISCQAVKKLGADAGTLGWRGAKSNGVQLHAKCLQSKQSIFSGSVNLTEQALWGDGASPINCEILVVSHKPTDFSLKKVCKGFTRIRLEDNFNEDNPSDTDVDDVDWGGDWNKELRLKSAAPSAVSLAYNDAKDIVEIKLDGKCKYFTRLKIYTKADGNIPAVFLAKKKLHRLTHSQQCAIAELILAKVVVTAKAYNGSKVVWNKDVNLGEFWLDIQSIRHLNGNGGNGGESGVNGTERNLTHKIAFDDVRDSREILLNSDISHHSYGRISWLHKHTKKIIGIPKWCFNFAKEIKDFAA